MDSHLDITTVDHNSRNVNVLLDLPSHLRTSVLAEWLEINDLARLDVAIVKGSLRQEYLTQLAHDRIALSGVPKISPHSTLLACLQWLVERNLCVKSIRFSAAMAAEEVQAVLQNQRMTTGVEDVEFERLDGIDERLFQRFITNCRNISSINLSLCVSLTDNFFQFQETTSDGEVSLSNANAATESSLGSSSMLTTTLPNLRHLLINNCTRITDRGISAVVQLAPNLSKLHCRGIARLTDESLRHASQLPHLEDIDFGLCRLLTDKGVRYLSQSKNPAVLSSINFYYCRNITDQSLIELSCQHPMIQSLNIAGCHAITDIGISRLATQTREHLVQLNVSGCIKITPESIAIIASNCRQLRRLNLSNIKSIDDECIRVLWRNCPHMEKLCLKECDQLTDAAFKALGFVWPKLDHLDLTYCSKVGDAGMLQIATYCPVLRMLRMTGCKLSLPCLRRATTINDQLHINIEQE